MIEALGTEAERQAQKAEELPAFSGIKLLHIKRQVAPDKIGAIAPKPIANWEVKLCNSSDLKSGKT